MMLENDVVDKLIESIASDSTQWYLDNDLVFNNHRIFIGNFDQPESLIVHIGGARFGVTKNTISKENAIKLSKVITEVRNATVSNQLNSILSQL